MEIHWSQETYLNQLWMRRIEGHYQNAHQLLLQIVKYNEARGKRVGYTFKRMGYNRKTAKRWAVMDLEKSCLRKKGMYVIFGKSKPVNPKHVQQFKSFLGG